MTTPDSVALPDELRVPMDELEADAGYLMGRACRCPHCADAMAESVRVKIRAIRAEVERLADQAADYKARKDAAYEERNKVVAALAKVFPSGIAKTAIEGWSEDWHGCVYIDLPTGQVSWHFHDSQAALFDGLPPYPGKWDGHDTPEKYRRLAALAAQTAPAYSGWVWKHIKSGGEYELLGNAKVQCDEPLTDMAEVYVYQGEDGRMWARPVAEFNARFKRSRPHGRPIAATANGSLLHGLAVAERCAAEVGAATTAQAVRMLTPEEEHALCIEHGATVSAHLLQAIQRKFCAVNAGKRIPADRKIGGV